LTVKGFIKLHRNIVNSDIYQMPPLYLRVFERLLLEANHDDASIPYKEKGASVIGKKLIKRGERLTSIRQIAEWVGWYDRGIFKVPNPKTIAIILDWLIANNMIQIYNQGNSQETHYNIVNYCVYQDKVNNESNAQVTVKKQSTDTNKNDKNDKNKQVVVEEENVFRFFQENIGLITPFQAELIQSYLDDGVEEKFVKEIIVDSIGKDNPWSWIRKVLESSVKKNIKTLEQYKATKVEHKRKAETKYKSNNAPPQTKNHEQRKYSDDYLNSLYEN